MPLSGPRIAVAFEFSTLNGGEQSMLAVIDQLAGASCEIMALCPPVGPLAAALSQRRIEVIAFDVRDNRGERLSQDDACEALRRAVRRAAPNLLHANSLSMGRLTGQLAPELPIPCVAHLRDIVGLSANAVRLLNQNNRLIAVSQATRAFHVQQGADPERTCVLYNGVDCQHFQPRPKSGAVRRELGIPMDAFLIAAIGQISQRKGQDLLASAAEQIRQGVPNAYYLIVGELQSAKQETAEFAASIVRRFEQAGLADHVQHTGRREDIPALLNEADLLVHPARQEPFGRVLLEAAASGTPIVATTVGGTTEMLVDGETARLIPPDDPHVLAEAIFELSGDSEVRERFASAARRHIMEHFTIEHGAAQLSELWATTAAGARQTQT